MSLLTSAATIEGVVTNLLDHVEQSIRARKLLPRGHRILVAVSGGLDSVALLHLLHALAVKHRWKLTVAHFNHQFRGRASNADERFVRAMATRLKLPCVAERANVRSHAKKHGLSIEMAARELRHEFLARTARRLKIRRVALAHHADDQVELFFLRLLRGTGGEGLAGMKWRSPSPAEVRSSAFRRSGWRTSSIRLKAEFRTQLVRPLLDVGRAELERYARERKIRFREDASNASRDILRNRIRHELLPLLRRRFQPAVNKTVLRLMDIAGAEAEVLAGVMKTHFKSKKSSPFASLPVALQRRALQRQLHQHNLAPDFELIERLRAAPGQPVSISPLAAVSRDRSGLVKLQIHTPVTFNENQIVVSLGERAGEGVFEGVHFQWRFDANKLARQLRRPRCEFFDADRVGAQVVLRHWRAGDRFQPIGMCSAVKLQDWFTNQKITRTRRHQLIVAASATGEIFWIEDQRIGERFKLTPQTKRRLIWRWKRR